MCMHVRPSPGGVEIDSRDQGLSSSSLAGVFVGPWQCVTFVGVCLRPSRVVFIYTFLVWCQKSVRSYFYTSSYS
jgi:hypothetical protein